MSLRSPVQAVVFDGWAKGLNLDAASSELEANELARAKNVVFSHRGEARHAGGQASNDVIRFSQFFEGYRRLFACAVSGAFYFSDNEDPSNWNNLSKSGGPFTNTSFYLEGNTSFRYGDGSDTIQYFTHGKVSGASPFKVDTLMAVTNVAGIPWGRYSLLWFDRALIAANDDYPNRIFISNLGDVETYDVADYIDVAPSDSDWITGLIPFGDNILVFKNRGIWQLSGRTPSSFTLYELTADRGACSEMVIKFVGGRVIFFDPRTGIWAFDGSAFEEISYPIRHWLREHMEVAIAAGWHWGSWFYARAEKIDDKYWLMLPNASSEFTDTEGGCLIWDPIHSAWSTSDIRFEDGSFDWATIGEVVLSSESKSWVYDRDVVTGPEATNLSIDIRTGWVRMGGGATVGRVTRVELIVEAANASEFDLTMYANYDETNSYRSRTITIGGDAFDVHHEIAVDGWGEKVRAFQFRIQSIENPFRIARMTVYYTGNPDIQGDHGS